MRSYIAWLRGRVGHERIILNFAAACAHDNQGRILLQQRSDKHAWGFPGGALELGESAEEAVIREVREETGLTVAVDYLLGVYTKYFDEYPNGNQAQTIAIFFVCSIIEGDLRTDDDETLALQYVDPANVPPLFNQQRRDALADYLAGRRGVYR